MIGTFVAQDLILFFVFFEVVLLPMYFMIGVWGGEQPRSTRRSSSSCSRCSARRSCSLSFLALYFLSDVRGAAAPSTCASLPTSAAPGIVHGTAASGSSAACSWASRSRCRCSRSTPGCPTPTPQAPTVGSVILAAVLLKLGTYGFIRIALPILPEAAETWAPCIGLLAVIGIIYGALVLSRADRHEAADRLLVGGPHGLRDARHRHPHRLRHQRRHLRHGRPRPHHRHAVLPRRLGAGPLPHARDRPPRRHAQADAPAWAGSSASAPWPRSASPAWPGSGASSRPSFGLQPGAAASTSALFRIYMVVAAIGTVLAAGYLLWLLQRVAFGTPTEEFADDPHIHDVSVTEWIAWVPLLVLIVVLGIFPNLIFHVTDPAVSRHGRRLHRDWRADPLLAQLVTFAWDAPSVDFHALAPEIVLAATLVVVLLVDALRRRATSGGPRRSIAGIGLLVALIPVVTLAVDGADRVDVRRRATWSTTTPWCSRRSSCSSAYVVVLLSTTTSPRATTTRASTTSCARVGARHDGHGLGPRPDHDLRRPRAALDPRLHARRLAQARPQGQRGRR